MTRIFWTLALGASMATLATREAAGGRGGGYGGGGMQRGYGGMQRGYGGMQRGYGGEGERGGYGGEGGMGHSPSFSQPRPQEGGSTNGGRNPSQSNAGSSNRNGGSNNSNAGAAAAGAGYANKNQSGNHSEAGAAAAGAGASNRNQSGNHPDAAPAAAGAGYANRNQSGNYSNAGAAAAGAAVGNRNGYDQGAMNAGYWNGNYGNGSVGGYGGMGMASPSYGYGSTPYVNPYASVMGMGMGGGGAGQPIGQGQPTNNVGANNAPAAAPASYDYTQPVNQAAAPPDMAQPADPSTTPASQAGRAFQAGDYANAVQLIQQALGQVPNDVGLHQFLALGLFAQGHYEQAAAPLYAVLAVGPGWDWTTLIGHYADAGAYTAQLRGLEAFARANPQSSKARFVQAYHYICQGQGQAAIKPLQAVLSMQPNDGVSARLLETLQPQAAASLTQPLDPGKLPGVWVAQAPPNATITLTISDDANFTWAFAAPGKPPVSIIGTYALANGVLTLSGKDTPGGTLAGKVASPDDRHLSFKAVGAPSSDPGLQFVR